MEAVRLPQNGLRYQGAGGEMEMWVVGSVIITRLCRFGHETFYPPFAERVGQVLRTEKTIAMFFDAASLERYDSNLRIDLTAFCREHKPQIRRIDVFSRSRVVSMGVSVASLALGGMVRAHSDVAAFRKAVDQELFAHRLTGFSTKALSE
jgi:hypothetical protein